MLMQSIISFQEDRARRRAIDSFLRPTVTPKTSKLTILVAALVVVSVISPHTALGADLETDNASANAPEQFDTGRYGDFRDTLADWKLTVGAGAIYVPEYEGSDKFAINPFPLFSASYGERVHVDITGSDARRS